MSTTHAPSLIHLRRALEISEQIQKLEAELQAVLGGPAPASASPVKKTRGRKKGWTKAKDGQAGKKAAATPKKARGQFTPEWRAKLAEAARQRWARARVAKKGA